MSDDTATTTATPSTAQRFATVLRVFQLNTDRLRELQTKGQTAVLSDGEVDEVVHLERQTDNQGQILAQLQAQIASEQIAVDVEGVVRQWGALVQAKREAYAHLPDALAWVEAVVGNIRAAQAAQERAIQRLPSRLREALGFPTADELVQRIDARLPAEVRGAVYTRGLSRGELQQLVDVDPGCDELSPRTIHNYLGKR